MSILNDLNENVKGNDVKEIPPKPDYRPVIAENIPQELKDHPYWCVWISELDKKKTKWTKPPYHPVTGRSLTGKEMTFPNIPTSKKPMMPISAGVIPG